MMKYWVKLQTLLANRKLGKQQSVGEYCLTLTLIACVCLVAFTAVGVGKQIKGMMETIGSDDMIKANAPAAGG